MKLRIDHKWLIALSVFTGALMSTLDTFILYIATPHLRGIFSATISEISWISTSYAVSALATMLISGWLCDKYGRKSTYQAGLLLFVIASLFCAFSTTIHMLIVMRIFQGIGAGILLPVENVILREIFPPIKHGLVMGVYGTTVMLGPSLGPILGGLIIDHLHWSYIFLVNVPLGLMGFYMVSRYLPYDQPKNLRSFMSIDWVGIILLIAGLFSLIWLLERGDRTFWLETDSNILLLFSAISLLALFAAHELMQKNPLIDLRVINNTVFRSTVVLNLMLGFVVTGTLFILPIYMQEVLGFSATQAGETLAPRALFMMLLFPLMGKIIGAVHAKVLIVGGLLLGITSAFAMSQFTSDTGSHDMLLPQIAQGLATVMVLLPLTTIGLKSVRPDQLASASGIDSMSRQIGGSLGIAVFSSLLTHYKLVMWEIFRHDISFHHSVFFKRFYHLVVYYFQSNGYSLHEARDKGIHMLNWRYEQQVAVASYMNIFQIVVIIFVVMLFLSLFLRLNRT